MAHHHVSAVFDCDRCSIDRLVLLSLAMRADDAGQCPTSIADIARDTGLARRTVQMHLGALIRARLVERFWVPGQAPVVRLRLAASPIDPVAPPRDPQPAATNPSQG